MKLPMTIEFNKDSDCFCVCRENNIYFDENVIFSFFNLINHSYGPRVAVVLYDSLINNERTNKSNAETNQMTDRSPRMQSPKD